MMRECLDAQYKPDAALRNHECVKSAYVERKTSPVAYGRKAIPALRRSEIQAQFQPGVTAVEVAAALGISPRTAASDLHALGWPLRCGYRASQSVLARRAEILAAIKAAPTQHVTAFAEQFKVSRQRISQLMRLAGFQKPRAAMAQTPRALRLAMRRQLREEQDAERARLLKAILSYYEKGYRQADIARALRVTQPVICRALRAARGQRDGAL